LVIFFSVCLDSDSDSTHAPRELRR